MEQNNNRPIRVLHSFPHRLGMSRICTTAWYEIDSAAEAGADLLAIAADSIRPFARPVQVRKTLAMGKLRLPAKLFGGKRLCALHDWLVARQLPSLADKVDIIHVWPLGALRTIRAAKRLGIPTALERCNAHTRFAFEVVQKECERLGVFLPPGHEHAYNEETLRIEEAEYAEVDALLCPSDFVVKTYRDRGFPVDRLVRFIYGVDENIYYPDPAPRPPDRPFTMISVGVCAVRKGLHYALDAWLNSPACKDGKFIIAGEFVPSYKDKLSTMLRHPSIHPLGHCNNVPELLRQSDILTLPSIEEGFGLVCTEAMASGCVPLVSDACTDVCRHEENAMVHPVSDVNALTDHISQLYLDRHLLRELRDQGVRDLKNITWKAAGVSLVEAYRRIVEMKGRGT